MNNGIWAEKQESSNKISHNVALFLDNCVESQEPNKYSADLWSTWETNQMALSLD